MVNAGQCCVAGSRTFVQEEIYDKFIEATRKLAEERRVGDPYDFQTYYGPQVLCVFMIIQGTMSQESDMLCVWYNHIQSS